MNYAIKMEKPKTTLINVRVKEEVRDELNAFAQQLEIPAAQIIREGLREKIAKLRADREAAEIEVALHPQQS